MSVMETLVTRRTYRRFEQKAIPQDVVDDIIEAMRLSSCGANCQAVRLAIVNKPEDVARIQPLEQGTHDELLAANGFYTKLHNRQFEGVES